MEKMVLKIESLPRDRVVPYKRYQGVRSQKRGKRVKEEREFIVKMAQELIARKEEAWNWLINTYSPRFVGSVLDYPLFGPLAIERSEAEELVQSFWAQKVVPDPERFFGEVARGKRTSFSAYLNTSFFYHFMDWLRSRKVNIPILDEDEVEEGGFGISEATIEAPSFYTPLEGYEHSEDLVYKYYQLIQVVNNVLESRNPPQHMAVLLAERIHFLKEAYHKGIGEESKIVEMAERLVPWSSGVGNRRFKEGCSTLNEIWEWLKEEFMNGRFPTRAEMSRKIGMGPSTLDQWVLRGRRKVCEIHYELLEELVPRWFKK